MIFLAAAVNSSGPSLTVHGIAAWLIIGGAVLTALGVIVKTVFGAKLRIDRPLRWLGRRIISDPMTGWVNHVVGSIVEGHLEPIRTQLYPNGGASLSDKVEKIGAGITNRIDALATVQEQQVVEVKALADQVGEQRSRLNELWEYSHTWRHDISNQIFKLTTATEIAPSMITALREAMSALEAAQAEKRTDPGPS